MLDRPSNYCLAVYVIAANEFKETTITDESEYFAYFYLQDGTRKMYQPSPGDDTPEPAGAGDLKLEKDTVITLQLDVCSQRNGVLRGSVDGGPMVSMFSDISRSKNASSFEFLPGFVIRRENGSDSPPAEATPPLETLVKLLSVKQKF